MQSITSALAVNPFDDSDASYLTDRWELTGYPVPDDAPPVSGPESFDLAQEIEEEVRCFEHQGTDAARLIAAALRDLVERVRFTGAATAADFEARCDLFAGWSSEGYPV